MQHLCSQQPAVSILHELDLGRHTLLLLSDGSIDLLANDEQTPYLAENGLMLDSDETYHLFIALHAHLTPRDTMLVAEGVSDGERQDA